MNQNTDLEDRLEALGAALRSRPRLTDRVMDEVRQSVTDGSIQDQSNSGRPSMLAPEPCHAVAGNSSPRPPALSLRSASFC